MPHPRRTQQGLLVLLLALALGVFFIVRNAPPPSGGDEVSLPPAATILPTADLTPTPRDAAWVGVISNPLLNPTATPGVVIVMPLVEPPTLTPMATNYWDSTPTPTRLIPNASPTRPAPTAAAPIPSRGGTVRDPNAQPGGFSPPPELAPLSLDPRDHFWFRRPVDSSANSTQLTWYVYGSNGPLNGLRVHHGIDLPNMDGKEVRAAGDGLVIWASDNYSWTEDGYTEYAYTYGNVVIVQHDFGFNGRRLYTLYAHLSLFLVSAGDRVRMGDVVGLSGRSGMVSGPHVHFEVRVGSNKYNATRNPILWMVPFEGHGVIAGRILAPNGQPIQDALVRLWQRKRVVDTTTTYVNPFWTDSQTYWNIVPDDVWRENFVFGDVPAGDYTLTVNVGNLDYEMQVTVRSATTSFVDFNLSQHEPTPSG